MKLMIFLEGLSGLCAGGDELRPSGDTPKSGSGEIRVEMKKEA